MSNEVKGQLYILDFTDPTTYTYDCGKINPPLWEVVRDSCTLSTTPVTIPVADSCGPIITYPVLIRLNASGNLHCVDRAYFWYMCGGNWTILDTIFGCNMTFVQTFTYNVSCPAGQPFAIKVSFITNHNTKKWQLRNNDIVIGYHCPVVLGLNVNSLKGEKTSSGNLISWDMTDDFYSDIYLERSYDNEDYEIVGHYQELNKKKTSTGEIQYAYVDKEIAPLPVAYYRIKVVDYNGNRKYSPIVPVKGKIKENYLSIFPNPTNGIFNIQLEATSKNNYNITVLDLTGKIVHQNEMLFEKGQHFRSLDLSHLKDGIYILLVKNKYEVHQQKIQIIRSW